MAMGGLMKGHGGNGNGRRGRPYGMMLLLAFGAAIIGVMVLHRFRERRIFNLLIKEKDTDLISLHLILQKERDQLKEAKLKLEDMRAKIHTLRAQKKELQNRITGIESTVSSLREEQKTIESALEEKQNEIKMLRHKERLIDNENPQVKALSEALRQKESEIEDLKHQLPLTVNIQTGGTDDPSNPSLNSQLKTTTIERDEINVNQGKDTKGKSNVSDNEDDGENSAEHADSSKGESRDISTGVAKQGDVRRESGGETAESREMTEEPSWKHDSSNESNTGETVEGEGKNSDKSQHGEENEITKTEVIGDHRYEMQRPRNETNGHTLDDKTTGEGIMDSSTQGAEKQEHGANLKGEVKSEMADNFQIVRPRRKGKSSILKRAKGKRWTIVTRRETGNSGNNRDMSGKTSKTSVESILADALVNSEPQNKNTSLRKETSAEDLGLTISDNLQKGEASVHEDSNYMGQEARSTASYLQVDDRERTNGTHIKTEIAYVSQKDVRANISIPQIDRKASRMDVTINMTTLQNKASLERQQDGSEIGESEKQVTEIQQLAEKTASDEEDEVSEETKTSDLDEEPNNPEIVDLQEQESETETSRESTSDTEADDEESKAENHEPEF